MAADVYGVSIVRLGGVDYRTRPGTKIKLGGVNKTAQMGSGIISGFSAEPVAAEVTGAFNILSDTDIEAIRNFEGSCEVVTDVGITWIVPDAVVSEPPEASDGGGGLSFTIIGKPAVKA